MEMAREMQSYEEANKKTMKKLKTLREVVLSSSRNTSAEHCRHDHNVACERVIGKLHADSSNRE